MEKVSIDIMTDAAARGRRYLEAVNDRTVFPQAEALENLNRFDEPLPDSPTDPAEVLALLDEAGSPATVATAGNRYYGFVIGGSLPAALGANVLAAAWDQNAGLYTASPVASKLEEVALRWMLDIFNLPADAGGGFVSGATMANFSALAAARHALLHRAGWDVESQGLFGAPEIKVVVGEEVHGSVKKALNLVGFGRDRMIKVPVDGQGRMRADALPVLDEMTLIAIQAGNVNTGAFDPAKEITAAANEAGAWVHVDGAFGLWAAASPEYAHLIRGYENANSWATDAHKWLNVPYDSGLVFVRNPEHLRAAMSMSGAYLIQGENREPYQYTPELSRRARGIEVWAALRGLGRSGLAALIEQTCRHATRFAEGLADAGYDVLNDVVINQVMVSFGDAETTRRVIKAVEQEGTMWAGPTEWQGHAAMRISVSSWATTDADVEQSLEAMIRVAKEITG